MQIEDIYNLGILIGQMPKQQDAYTWSVIYTDGSSISEYDRPEGRCFAEVDCAEVSKITITSDRYSYAMDIPEGAHPVFFRRRSVTINLESDQQEDCSTKHCIGWKRRGGEAEYLFVLDDGQTLLTSDLQAI